MDYEPMKNDDMDSDTRKEIGQLKKNIDKKQNPMQKVILNAIKTAVITMLAKMLPFLLIGAVVLVLITGFQQLLDGGGTGVVASYDDDLLDATASMDLYTYLMQFSNSGEAPQSDDGKYYKMHSDGKWPTIGNSDLQWASFQTKFDCEGKVLQNGTEKTVPSVKDYVNSFLTRGSGQNDYYTQAEVNAMNIYIEKELVDSVGAEAREAQYAYVQTQTDGLSLSKQQLYALTAIAYNFGHLPTRNGYTFKSVYESGAALYEVNSWEHNRFIWDNWWCYLGGGFAGHIPARDAAFETYVKGVYDFSTSDAGEIFGRKYYIYYTQTQLNMFSYAPSKTITRDITDEANEIEIFTYVRKSGATGTFDGEYVTTEKYNFPHYLQNNYAGAFGSSTIAAAGCGPTSMAMILSGFLNDSSITPVTYIEAMDEYYDGDWTQYYLPGAGSIYAGICNNEFLQEYYGCSSYWASSASVALQAIKNGNAVIAAEEGHILALIPLPEGYSYDEYTFFVLDSARGHSGAFKSVSDFISSTSATKLEFRYVIQPHK